MTTRNPTDDAAAEQPPPGSIADTYRLVMPLVAFEAAVDKGGDVLLTIPSGQLRDVVQRAREDQRLQMNLLRNQTAVDWPERGLELVYHFYSVTHKHAVTLKAWLPEQGAAVDSIADLYPMADWAERECREMFGIEFHGHPDPRNLLLDEDLDIHPLRKSHPLAQIEIEQGVEVEFFTKEHPPEEPVSPQDKAAAETAQVAAPARKRDEDLTPEELAAKQAEQAERVARARELAAARRKERAAGAPPAGGPRAEGAAPPPTPAAAPAAAAPAAETAPAAAPPPDDRPPAPPPPELPQIPDAEEDPEGRAAAQTERVRVGRELAAARRAQLRGQ